MTDNFLNQPSQFLYECSTLIEHTSPSIQTLTFGEMSLTTVHTGLITALIASAAVCIALLSFLFQKKLARVKSAQDILLQMSMDKSYKESYAQFKELRNHNKLSECAKFRYRDRSKHTENGEGRYLKEMYQGYENTIKVLNYYELLSILIKTNTIDE
ncbi:MAG: DUF4760 domain-containing protein, partial [Pseudomonadota bacterium]